MDDLRNKLAQYRRDEPPKPLSRFQRRLDVVNNLPLQPILANEFGIYVPELLERSWKTNCPFSYEHPDGGMDKNCRIYAPGNHMFCFALIEHGRMGAVDLISRKYDWKVPRAVAWLEEQNNIVSNEPHWEKMQRLIVAREQRTTSLGEPADAVAALQYALKALPGYTLLQYDQAILEAVNARLGLLDDVLATGDGTELQQWLVESREIVKGLL